MVQGDERVRAIRLENHGHFTEAHSLLRDDADALRILHGALLLFQDLMDTSEVLRLVILSSFGGRFNPTDPRTPETPLEILGRGYSRGER
jgi:hypothetical protein